MQVCANITGDVELEISVSASLEVVQAEDQGSYIVHALVLGLLAPLVLGVGLHLCSSAGGGAALAQ